MYIFASSTINEIASHFEKKELMISSVDNILATSCDSILERCGIYRNHHLLFMLDKLSVTEVINPNPGFIPAHLAVLSWVLRSLPLLSPATI